MVLKIVYAGITSIHQNTVTALRCIYVLWLVSSSVHLTSTFARFDPCTSSKRDRETSLELSFTYLWVKVDSKYHLIFDRIENW